MGRPPAAATAASTCQLRTIRALPSLELLSHAGVSIDLTTLPTELELTLSKSEWKSDATASIPTRHLRAGLQDVTLRVPRLGQVCVAVEYVPADPAVAARAAAA